MNINRTWNFNIDRFVSETVLKKISDFFDFCRDIRLYLRHFTIMVIVAQLVRALDCGSRGRGFKSRLSPYSFAMRGFFIMSYWVYILHSTTRDQLYIGQTQDIDKRLKRHNQGYVKSTKNRGPWELYYSKMYPSRSAAMKTERQLKNLKSRSRIDQWIARQD